MRAFENVTVVCDWKTVEDAIAVRAVLESFRLRVQFLRLVQRRQVFDFFAGRGVSDCSYTVLVCHGTGTDADPTIRLQVVDQVTGDPYAPEGWEVATVELSAATIADTVTAARGTLVSTACGSGREPLAAAFLAAGYDAYVAPVGRYHDSDAAVLFVAGFFYHLLAEDRDYAATAYTEVEAVRRAASIDRDSRFGTGVFRHYSAKGLR